MINECSDNVNTTRRGGSIACNFLKLSLIITAFECTEASLKTIHGLVYLRSWNSCSSHARIKRGREKIREKKVERHTKAGNSLLLKGGVKLAVSPSSVRPLIICISISATNVQCTHKKYAETH